MLGLLLRNCIIVLYLQLQPFLILKQEFIRNEYILLISFPFFSFFVVFLSYSISRQQFSLPPFLSSSLLTLFLFPRSTPLFPFPTSQGYQSNMPEQDTVRVATNPHISLIKVTQQGKGGGGVLRASKRETFPLLEVSQTPAKDSGIVCTGPDAEPCSSTLTQSL